MELIDLIAIVISAAIGAAALSSAASAHRPILVEKGTSGYEDAIEIPDPDISWAAYGFIEKPGDRGYFYWDLRKPSSVYTELLVPKSGAYAHFHPSYAIVGPGLMAPNDLGFDVPAGLGALVIDDDNNASDVFYEPFTGITYFRGKRTHTFLGPGRYYLVVFDRQGSRGDYVLAVGERESFGLSDIPGVIAAVLKIRSGAFDHSATAGQK